MVTNDDAHWRRRHRLATGAVAHRFANFCFRSAIDYINSDVSLSLTRHSLSGFISEKYRNLKGSIWSGEGVRFLAKSATGDLSALAKSVAKLASQLTVLLRCNRFRCNCEDMDDGCCRTPSSGRDVSAIGTVDVVWIMSLVDARFSNRKTSITANQSSHSIAFNFINHLISIWVFWMMFLLYYRGLFFIHFFQNKKVVKLRGNSWASANDLRISDSSGHSERDDDDVDAVVDVRRRWKTGLLSSPSSAAKSTRGNGGGGGGCSVDARVIAAGSIFDANGVVALISGAEIMSLALDDAAGSTWAFSQRKASLTRVHFDTLVLVRWCVAGVACCGVTWNLFSAIDFNSSANSFVWYCNSIKR